MTRRVIIAGGGPGGIETALALRALASGVLDVELLTDRRWFSYRPWAVAEPFDTGRSVRVDVARVADEAGFAVSFGLLGTVEAEARTILTEHGARPYDALVLALGARPVPAVPGALLFRGHCDSDRLRVALNERCRRDGASVAYVVPAASSWPLPAYELALLTRRWAEDAGVEVTISVVTPELTPLEVFGPEVRDEVTALLAARRIDVHPASAARAVRGGRVHRWSGDAVTADLTVALPGLLGSPLPGLPADEHGFVPVDGFGRVPGLDGVYAIGDMTTHPIRQGGLATQQADVVAAHIAAGAGVTVSVEPYRPVLRAMLLTGGEPRYLHQSPVPAAASAGGGSAPWWPPHKIVGHHLSPFLATHADTMEVITP